MDPLEHAVRQQWPPEFWQNHRLVIGCSGGPDSTALVHLLADWPSLRGRILVGHFHHGMRGRDADDDAAFVEEFCAKLGLPLVTGRTDADELAEQARGEGMESAARQLRYRFLISAAENSGARYLLMGHTADDHAETVLYHTLRGTGLAGLSGIPAIRVASQAVTIARPLLACRRSEIATYLQRNAQDYCLDALNNDPQFRRNRIRHQLLPWIEQQINPAVHSALIDLARVADDAQQIILDVVRPWAEEAIHIESPDCARIDLDQLHTAPAHVRRELFVQLWRQQQWPRQGMTFRHWQRLADLASTELADQRFDLPGAIDVRRENDQIELRRTGTSAD